MDTKDTFHTFTYKNEYIQTCQNRSIKMEEIKWRGKQFKSLHAVKCAISRFINSARPSALDHVKHALIKN